MHIILEYMCAYWQINKTKCEKKDEKRKYYEIFLIRVNMLTYLVQKNTIGSLPDSAEMLVKELDLI